MMVKQLIVIENREVVCSGEIEKFYLVAMK